MGFSANISYYLFMIFLPKPLDKRLSMCYNNRDVSKTH